MGTNRVQVRWPDNLMTRTGWDTGVDADNNPAGWGLARHATRSARLGAEVELSMIRSWQGHTPKIPESCYCG